MSREDRGELLRNQCGNPARLSGERVKDAKNAPEIARFASTRPTRADSRASGMVDSRRNNCEEQKPPNYTLRRISAGLGFTGLAATAAILNPFSGSGEGIPKAEERATEGCVAALVGRKVDLVPNQQDPGLQLGPGVVDEQLACQNADNNPDLARMHLGQ